MPETASEYIADALDRAQKAFALSVDHTKPRAETHLAMAWLQHHVCTVVLLERLRRLDEREADWITSWLLSPNGIFADGYPGELVHQWRQQIAAGLPLDPIGPEEDDTDG